MFRTAQIRLEQFGVKMDDMDMFVKSVVGMSRENYNYVQILAKIAEHEKLEKDIGLLQRGNYCIKKMNLLN